MNVFFQINIKKTTDYNVHCYIKYINTEEEVKNYCVKKVCVCYPCILSPETAS